MNLNIGSQTFINVEIPVLWGTRAVLQDSAGKLSVIDLSGKDARLEIVDNEPGPGVDYKLTPDGIVIIVDDTETYSFDPKRGSFSSDVLGLPDTQITTGGTTVGGSRFSGNMVMGAAVGLMVTKDGIAMGVTRLPEGLAKLVI